MSLYRPHGCEIYKWVPYLLHLETECRPIDEKAVERTTEFHICFSQIRDVVVFTIRLWKIQGSSIFVAIRDEMSSYWWNGYGKDEGVPSCYNQKKNRNTQSKASCKSRSGFLTWGGWRQIVLLMKRLGKGGIGFRIWWNWRRDVIILMNRLWKEGLDSTCVAIGDKMSSYSWTSSGKEEWIPALDEMSSKWWTGYGKDGWNSKAFQITRRRT
jgi:hypothetical protein